MNSNLNQSIFESHVKALQEEREAMLKFNIEENGEGLTVAQQMRLFNIDSVLNAVYDRKIAFDQLMRSDIQLLRGFDALGIDIQKPLETPEQ